MQLTFLGAAGTVTGSKYLVETRGRRILVDCGLFQGLKELRLRNRADPGFDPRTLDAVVLTHAHLDHSGYVPVLVRNGYQGPVYCTAATRDLCEILLRDSGHLQEEDARYANSHGFSKHHPALPLYTEDDAVEALRHFEPVGWDRPVPLGGGVTARFRPAGHLLGAATILLDDGETTILFSGDLGRPNDPLVPPPAEVEGADFLVVESTYGNRRHGLGDSEVELADAVNRTGKRGGAVLVPAFCIGRAQQVLHHLRRLEDASRVPPVPVFLDSPMAAAALDLHVAYQRELRLSAAECKGMATIAKVSQSVEDSKEIDRLQGPMVIVAGSGMATGGRILHHLKVFAPDYRNTVLFTGYQAVGTRGADLVAGKPEVKIHGRWVPIRAEVDQIDSMSAHGDYVEILEWLRPFTHPPQRVFVTHGEPEASRALAQRIEGELGWTCTVPAHGERVVLEPGRGPERRAGRPGTLRSGGPP